MGHQTLGFILASCNSSKLYHEADPVWPQSNLISKCPCCVIWWVTDIFFTNSFHQTERGWHFMVMRQQNLWWRWKSATLVDSDWTFEAHHHLRTSKQHLDQGVVRQCGTLGLGQHTSTAIEVCEVWVFFSGFAYSPLQFLSSGVHVQVYQAQLEQDYRGSDFTKQNTYGTCKT